MAFGYVQVRARVRFMIYGDSPAPIAQVDNWVLKVPSHWLSECEAGKSTDALTSRCGEAVQRQYAEERSRALATAAAAEARGEGYDAGHYIFEGASVWRIGDDELQRRPWLGRPFYHLDDEGLRAASKDEAPQLEPLTPFEDHAYKGWRLEENESWGPAQKAYAEAQAHRTEDANVDLVAEIAAGHVRAAGKVGALDEVEALSKAYVELLGELNADSGALIFLHVRRGEALLSERHAGAAEAFQDAIDAIDDDDGPRGRLHASLGLARLRQGDFAAAEAAFAIALREDDTPRADDGTARHNLALCLERRGENTLAEMRLKEAIATATPGESAWVDSTITLARVLGRQGKIAAASALLTKARASYLSRDDEGHHLWASGVIAEAAGEPAKDLLRRAAEIITDPVLASWIAEDAAKSEGEQPADKSAAAKQTRWERFKTWWNSGPDD